MERSGKLRRGRPYVQLFPRKNRRITMVRLRLLDPHLNHRRHFVTSVIPHVVGTGRRDSSVKFRQGAIYIPSFHCIRSSIPTSTTISRLMTFKVVPIHGDLHCRDCVTFSRQVEVISITTSINSTITSRGRFPLNHFLRGTLLVILSSFSLVTVQVNSRMVSC